MFKNDIDMIKTSRLLEFKNEQFYWCKEPITLNDVIKAVENKIPEINEQYTESMVLMGDFKNKEWHLGRIIYFINHPEKIDAITIDNRCECGQILPIPFIEDGNHRFMAVNYLGWEEFESKYSGRVDVLEYLQGTTDQAPC